MIRLTLEQARKLYNEYSQAYDSNKRKYTSMREKLDFSSWKDTIDTLQLSEGNNIDSMTKLKKINRKIVNSQRNILSDLQKETFKSILGKNWDDLEAKWGSEKAGDFRQIIYQNGFGEMGLEKWLEYNGFAVIEQLLETMTWEEIFY